ncbi:MAG: isoleucine--tRNA ligase, partial [Syntrophomonadaceae bacterium]
VHPEFEYVVVSVNKEKYIVAKGLLEEVAGKLDWSDYEILSEFKGEEIDRAVCRHPFIDRESLVVLGDHVSLEAGTGCVHTAPGHGEDDFYVGREYGLQVLSPVDDQGRFTDEAQPFTGLYVHDANQQVIEKLQENNALLNASQLQHQYPFCWRCKHPIIYRATEQWFASIDGFRQEALQAIDRVEWIPSWGRDRIYNMVRDRGDWCISRQRTWGVPIPIFYCQSCGEPIINDETIQRISDLFAEHGSDIWFIKKANDLLPPGYTCEHCGGRQFSKETDTMDVWFDSGSSHMGVLETYPELRWPADMYLEGSDQHRGWFNSSLSTAVAVRGTAPYRQVLTHGFVVDEQGRKMSKSLGNVVDPLKMINELGADILRLWIASADYRTDVSVSENIIRQSAEAYRKIRNTCRFILGNLYDFDYEKDQVPYEKLSELDRWALMKAEKLLRRVTKAYREYEFHIVFHSIHNFCTVDLSNIYFDILKDTLYCSHPDDQRRKGAQTVLYKLINDLVIMLTPILAFTTEEIWSFLRRDDQPQSVQLLSWPEENDLYLDDALEQHMDKVLQVREVVTKALEEARSRKIIGHSLASKVIVYANDEWYKLLQGTPGLEKIFIVSQLELVNSNQAVENGTNLENVDGIWVTVEPAQGGKCERCWIIDSSVSTEEEQPALCSRCSTVVEALDS